MTNSGFYQYFMNIPEEGREPVLQPGLVCTSTEELWRELRVERREESTFVLGRDFWLPKADPNRQTSHFSQIPVIWSIYKICLFHPVILSCPSHLMFSAGPAGRASALGRALFTSLRSRGARLESTAV